MFNLMRKHHKKFISLKNLTPRTENNKKLKQEVLINAGDLYNSLYYIYKNKYNKKINSLDTENRTKLDHKKLRLADDYEYSSEEEEEKAITDLNAFKEWIIKKEANINSELFRQYFNYQTPSALFNVLHNLKDNPLKSNVLVHVIESGLIYLEKKIKEMSEEEIKIEKLDKIVEIVGMILKFNKQNQEAKGLNILTPQQMLSRLQITLARLKAVNNSDKLKNEIRQLLYSLHRSKNMAKQVYNNLINHI